MNSDGLPSSSSSQDHEILNALYEGRITESQLAELDRRMLQDEELRRHYIRLMHLHSSLHDHAAVLEGGPVIDRLLPLRKYVYGSAIAAAIVLSFWLVRYLVSPRFSPQTVASVIDVSSAQWGEFEPSHRIGNGINAGQHLVLDSGCVELLFSSGCRAIIEGPADFTATSAKELELRQGKISATMQGAGSSSQLRPALSPIWERSLASGLLRTAGQKSMFLSAGWPSPRGCRRPDQSR